MGKSISASANRRGRPVTTGTGTTIGVRMLDGRIAALDAWIAKQKEPELSRPEAIRRLVELGLTVKSAARPTAKAAARAAELAAKAIDEHADTSAPSAERESRKNRLLKGPSVFWDVRKGM
jgi:hypothetical protein